MRLHLLLCLVVSFLCGCASHTVSEETIASWMQRDDERGKLTTARIVSIERLSFTLSQPPSSSAALVGVVGPGLAPAVAAVADTIRDTGFFYRHRLRLKSGEEKVFDLHFRYREGECVALRPGLSANDTWPIRALPGECQ
jgi:hypothetical protein